MENHVLIFSFEDVDSSNHCNKTKSKKANKGCNNHGNSFTGQRKESKTNATNATNDAADINTIVNNLKQIIAKQNDEIKLYQYTIKEQETRCTTLQTAFRKIADIINNINIK